MQWRELSSLKLQRDRYAVAQRQDRRKQLRYAVEQPVVFGNDSCARVRAFFRVGHVAPPQNVIGDKQTAVAHARDRELQRARVILLIDIVEDDVEGSRSLL